MNRILPDHPFQTAQGLLLDYFVRPEPPTNIRSDRKRDYIRRYGDERDNGLVMARARSGQFRQRRWGGKDEMGDPQSRNKAEQDQADHIVSIKARHARDYAMAEVG